MNNGESSSDEFDPEEADEEKKKQQLNKLLESIDSSIQPRRAFEEYAPPPLAVNKPTIETDPAAFDPEDMNALVDAAVDLAYASDSAGNSLYETALAGPSKTVDKGKGKALETEPEEDLAAFASDLSKSPKMI